MQVVWIRNKKKKGEKISAFLKNASALFHRPKKILLVLFEIATLPPTQIKEGQKTP